MKVAWLAVLAVSGCKSILGIESGVVGSDASIDAAPDAIDAPPDVPPDARTCFGTYQPICLKEQPTDDYTVTTTTTLETLLGCSETQTIGGVDVCIRAAKNITVAPGVQLSTLGSKFIVLVATETMTISGTLDSWNAGTTVCATNQGEFSGGGPGGSFGALGGVGPGQVMNADPIPVPATITTFRRGCPGSDGGSDAQAGDGGPSGSGIFLVSPSIHLTSTARINASGFGGGGGNNDRGGGGGGSGGLVLFDSDALRIDAGALVIAVGGGGGGGGGAGTGTSGTRATLATPTAPGLGGDGNAAASGDGGDGGLLSLGMNGALGFNGRGSGGGGGGTGVIFTTATTVTNNGTVIPAARVP